MTSNAAPATPSRVARVADRALQALAAVLAVSTTLAGLHDVSRAWDVWYYHLPFAARLAGIVGSDAYGLNAANESRLAGFPLLVELAQGVAWRVTGRPEGANLVSMASLALLVVFLRRAFAIPLHLAFLALLAIPLVQIHVTSCYIDLPANVAAAMLVLLVVRIHARADPPAPKEGVWVFGLAAVVANMRFQLHPIVAVAVVAALPRVLPPLWRARDGRGIATLSVLVPVVGATFLKNAFVHGNPYYPMRLEVLGRVLPGPDTPYSSSPIGLEHLPRMARFAFSIFEIGVRPLTDGRRWTIDQWAPEGSPALRMGGFFGAYVAFLLITLAWLVVSDRSRRSRAVGVGFVLFTLVVANLPQSHELRYYLGWMLVLVALTLWLAAQETQLATRRIVLGFMCLPFLGVVLWVTEAGYVYPSGISFAELVRESVDASVLVQIHDGDRVCIDRSPHTFLYAARFHARRYYVREAAHGDGAEGASSVACGDARPVR